jgi:hypothetical protein
VLVEADRRELRNGSPPPPPAAALSAFLPLLLTPLVLSPAVVAGLVTIHKYKYTLLMQNCRRNMDHITSLLRFFWLELEDALATSSRPDPPLSKALARHLSKALARHLSKGLSMRLPSSEDPIYAQLRTAFFYRRTWYPVLLCI